MCGRERRREKIDRGDLDIYIVHLWILYLFGPGLGGCQRERSTQRRKTCCQPPNKSQSGGAYTGRQRERERERERRNEADEGSEIRKRVVMLRERDRRKKRE